MKSFLRQLVFKLTARAARFARPAFSWLGLGGKLGSAGLLAGFVVMSGCASPSGTARLETTIMMPLAGHAPADRRQLLGSGDPARNDWNLRQIQQQNGFRVLAGPGARTVVAVLDTGADPRQPVLSGHLYPVEDIVGQDEYKANGQDVDFTGIDGNGHGTHVSGIVTSVASAFNVRVLPVKVIPNTGVGDDRMLAEGIERALAWHDPADPSIRVRVMNLSVSSPRVSTRLTTAIRHATDAGIIVVGASGNEGKGVDFPASMPEVLTVGATTAADEVADYSCFGPAVDLTAPGGSDDLPIYSTWPTYLTSDDIDSGVTSPHMRAGLIGTSMAAPHVAAMAAICWCMHPNLSARQVRTTLLAMSDDLGAPGPDNHYGYGRLNYARIMGATTDDLH
jgi:subtilisin family serine protease